VFAFKTPSVYILEYKGVGTAGNGGARPHNAENVGANDMPSLSAGC